MVKSLEKKVVKNFENEKKWEFSKLL